MRSSKPFLVAVAVSLLPFAIVVAAPEVDMNDPRRSVGREDDIRIDAQLLEDTVASGSPIGISYQVHNLTELPVGIAEKLCGASYDPDTRTITLAVGSEIPSDGNMPRLTIIPAGGKKTFTTGATIWIATPAAKSPFLSLPRYVQIKVSVLRNLLPFRALLDAQSQSKRAEPSALSDELFDQWLESSGTILLNSVPIQYEMRGGGTSPNGAERHTGF